MLKISLGNRVILIPVTPVTHNGDPSKWQWFDEADNSTIVTFPLPEPVMAFGVMYTVKVVRIDVATAASIQNLPDEEATKAFAACIQPAPLLSFLLNLYLEEGEEALNSLEMRFSNFTEQYFR